jgi:lysophospholipase L1-like esterase
MSSPPQQQDDSLMNRFERLGLNRFRARDAVVCVLLIGVLLVLFQGASIRKAGKEMKPGIGRALVLAVGEPAGWVADRLPLASVSHGATAWLNPEASSANGPGAFGAPGAVAAAAAAQVPTVTPEAFSATTLGAKPPPRRPLHTLLVTGDSMSEPLDDDLARALDPKGVHVVEEPHLGTGISTTFIVNWGALAVTQVKRYHPDAVVIFIGADDGFPMAGPGGREIECCGAEWAAIYANRARQMADTYRQGGAARVYWITLPTPREAARQQIARVVNAAVEVAAEPWAEQVHIIDSVPTFTPGGVYRDAMPVEGKQTIVRQADGIHLNDAGSSLLAGIVLGRLGEEFTY